MSAAQRVAHAAQTIRARWEREVTSDPQMEAAQALEDTGQLLDPEVAAELAGFRKERELADAVAALGALPVPVGPVPSERDRLRAAFVAALDEAHQTHPCPVTGRPYWTGCVHYGEAGRVIGVGSCHSERRADAVLAVRDAEVERLRVSLREACDQIAELESNLGGATARVAELESERHVTNEALDDAVQALRLRNTQRGDVELLIEQERGHGEECVDIDALEAALSLGSDDEPGSSTDGITQRIAPTQALQEDPFGLHHNYRVPRDLPETGGAK